MYNFNIRFFRDLITYNNYTECCYLSLELPKIYNSTIQHYDHRFFRIFNLVVHPTSLGI